MPQNIYDDPEFFAGYSQLRRSREGLAGAPEWPVLRSMLPPLEGARVLDLGCGFGAFARWAREMGAVSVLGIDRSQNMLAQARAQTHDSAVTYDLADIEHLRLPEASFDLVYSALTLHYIEDFGAVATMIRRVLVPGGHLVFSVEHPLFTAPRNPGWRTETDGAKVWPTNEYLLEGRRVTEWITPGIVKYHRTVANYVNSLLAQGFQLVHLEEWGPNKEQIAAHPEWADEVHRPPFLLLAARLEEASTVVFVCEHGSVKSVIAAQWFNRLASEHGLRLRAVSRGVDPDPAVPPGVAENLRKDGFEVDGVVPTRLERPDLAKAAHVVAIGAKSPLLDAPGTVPDRWDDIPPASTNYGASRNAIRRRIEALLDRLAEGRGNARPR